MPSYTTQEQVMFFDTDIGGVVHNIAYLRMIETCRTMLAEQVGFDLKKMAETQVFPVVARTEIDYRKPATLGDKLSIHGRIAEHTRTAFWCEFEVRNHDSPDTLYVKCRQKLAVVQMPAGKPVRIPEEALSHFSDL